MSIKTRRLIFYSFVLLFIIIGTLIILFSRGFRFDIDNFDIVETGGIYISSKPLDVNIKFDNRNIKNKTSIFQKGTLINGVSSGEHQLEITYADHSIWRKNFEVEPSEVSVFDSVLLIPNAPPLQIEAVLAENFISRNGHVAYESEGGVLLDGKIVFGHQIIDFVKGKKLLTKSNKTNNYYITDVSSPESSLNLTLIFNNLKSDILGLPGAVTILDIEPYLDNENRFIITTAKATYILDSQRSSIAQVALGVDSITLQKNNHIVWIEDSEIVEINSPFRGSSSLLKIKSSLNTAKGIYLVDGQWIVLTNSGDLLLIEEEYEKIATGVTSIFPDAGSNKIVFLHGNKLSVYSPEDKEVIQLSEINGSLVQLDWIEGDSHIIVLAGGKLSLVEVDNRTPINIFDIANDVSRFSYEASDGYILFLNGSGVWQKNLKL